MHLKKVSLSDIPVINTAQMIRVDELMMGKYVITLIQMMENAGRALAALAWEILGKDLKQKQIAILAGKGGNGGGTLVAARIMHNWGAAVSVTIPYPEKEIKKETAQQLQILKGLDIQIGNSFHGDYDLIIDGLIGYSINGNPKQPISGLINQINAANCPVVSLDSPSGLDLTRGIAFSPVVNADYTLTLALPKYGLVMDVNKPIVGKLYLADISVPIELYRELGLETDKLKYLFSGSDMVQIIL
jgi:NAD(P)H-hydrate epimerase